MKILAFDTATAATTVAICGLGPAGPGGSADLDRPSAGGPLAPRIGCPPLELEARDDPPRGQRPRHTTRLMALVVQVLQRSGLDWPEIDRIAVGVGPGTFTGLRIGIATARALGQARGIPLVGVSTLRSLALSAGSEPAGGAQAAGDTAGAVVGVLDARRKEVFAAGWRLCSDPVAAGTGSLGAPLMAPSAFAPERLAELIGALGCGPLALGEGAIEYRSVLERSGALIPDDDSALHRVTALNHCRLAHDMPLCAPDQVQPEYLRLPDATIARAAGTR